MLFQSVLHAIRKNLYKSEMRIVMIQTTLGDARVKPGALLLPVAMVEEPYDTL